VRKNKAGGIGQNLCEGGEQEQCAELGGGADGCAFETGKKEKVWMVVLSP